MHPYLTEHKNYHALLEDKIYMGGATDVEAMVKNEGIQVIVDLRGEATECAYPEAFAEFKYHLETIQRKAKNCNLKKQSMK